MTPTDRWLRRFQRHAGSALPTPVALQQKHSIGAVLAQSGVAGGATGATGGATGATATATTTTTGSTSRPSSPTKAFASSTARSLSRQTHRPRSKSAVSGRTVTTSSSPLSSLAYALQPASVSGLPLPPLITESYLQDEARCMRFSMRVSFFDMELGVFLGETWRLPGKGMNVRDEYESSESGNGKGDDGEDDDEHVDCEQFVRDVKLNGRLLTVDFAEEMELLFHSSLVSTHILLVVEYEVQVERSLVALPRLAASAKAVAPSSLLSVSLGWSIIHPWNATHGGLNVVQHMRAHPGSFADEPLTRKAASVPVYAGSPRMLLAIPNANVDKDVPSYFGLVTARPSATLTYTLSIDPDMRFISTLLPEHACFCTTDVVPGMDTRDMIAITASNSVAVAEFEVDFAAELEAAEAAFLREFSNACGVHAVDCTDTNAAPPMEIIERRLIVALHNGRTFIGTPTVIALQESPDFDNLLRFPGSIALDRWPAADGIAVVFALEYAVAVTGGREMTGRKSWFSRSAPPAGLTMSGGGEAVRENERRVCLGWAAWVPDDRRTAQEASDVPLRWSASTANPFGTPMFNIEALPVFAVDDVAHADDPALTIGFRFTPERGSSRPSSPTKRKPQVVVKSATSPVATPTKVAITTSTTDLQQRATLASSTLDNAPIELESLPRKSPSKDQSKTSVANLLIQNAQERIVGQLTRAQRARLCVPGHFTPVHDARGLIVDTVVVGAASTRLKSDMNAVALSKWADVQCSREIGITLLGLSQLQSEHVHALYFTVQFAAFPLVQSQFVVLGRKAPVTVDDDGMTMTAKSSSGGMDTVMPQLFYSGTGNNHLVADDKGVPGVYLKFEWDDRAHASIAQQLLRPDAAIHVDVWSAESRLPLASVSIPSVLLLRGDPTLAQSSMYDFPLDAPHASTELGPLLTRSAVQGLLHVRLSSVPYATVALDNAWSCQVGDTVRSGRGVAFGRAMPVKLVDYRESLRHQRTASGTLRVKAEKIAVVDAEVDEGLRMIHQNIHLAVSMDGHRDSDAEQQRKMEKIKQFRGAIGGLVAANAAPEDYSATRKEKSLDLEFIDTVRDRKKSLYIGKALEDQMTTHHDIHPQFGAGQFFEFELSNPLATDELIDIQLHDRDVRLVRDLNEWRYLRRVHGVRGGAIEKEMVSVDPMDGTPQIWLRGNETVSVPFVFQSFAMPEEEPEQMAKFKERVAPVSFLLTSTKKPVAILDLHVKRQAWFPVDRTLRFYHPANEMLRTTIAYVPQSMVDAERAFDSDKPSAMYLRASHANILCQFDESVPRNSNASALQLRYRCGGTSSPATSETFYILFYHDPFHTALAGVWRFVVHTTDRLDVHGAVGQKTPASLMVKVAGAGQTVQCHASHADMVTFTPSGTFDLVGNALNEVRIAVRAGATGRQHYLVSMVDVEGGDKGGLVGHWLVNCSSMEPDVTKEFELEVPREVGLSKRVSYTNPYLSARRFILTSSQPSKLQVKERMLELDSGESTYIHLLFPPLSQQQSGTSASAIVEDHVFLFISDEQEQPEECLRIALSYV